MRQAILTLLLATSYATAGLITTSTIGHATASVSYNPGPDFYSQELFVQAFSNGPTTSEGNVTFSDTFSLIGPASGFVDITVSARSFRVDGFGIAGATIGSFGFSFNGGPLKIATFQVPFVQFQPISLSAQVNGRAADFAPDNPNEGAAEITISLHLSHFKVFDSNRAPITDYSYVTTSGGPLPFLVPEPGTILLMASGLALIIWLRRKNSTMQ